jgi:putative phosphoribosyl transferase
MKTIQKNEVMIPAGEVTLLGNLYLPLKTKGMVLFAHGSGSGRFSPRNQFVAEALAAEGIASLLSDLLNEWEAEDRQKVFDIDLLSERLLHGLIWVINEKKLKNVPVGLFGASTGAAAALSAAAQRPREVKAVVSRGGRPDLVPDSLSLVKAPTLLIVGGHDRQVIELNRTALSRLHCTKELVIVPDAGHLFEEPGTLEKVAALAIEWFGRHFEPMDEA